MSSSGGRTAQKSVIAYDRQLVPWLFEHWARPMVDAVDPARSSHIVDLACGTGLLVRHLLGRLDGSGRIDGVDVDGEMLGYAATTVDDSRVGWYVADAARLPFEHGSVDRVCCHQGLQFFPARPEVLAEIGRVLVPGGRLALAVWGPIEQNPWPAALSTAVRRLVGDVAGASMAMVCDLGDPAEVTGLLEHAGFEHVAVDVLEHRAVHCDVSVAVESQLTALPSGTAIGELDETGRAELVGLMCELLADHTDGNGRLAVRSTSTFARAAAPGTTS